MPRLPTKADFSPDVVVDIVPPTPPGEPSSILILLHGLGDNQLPYTRLGHAIKLPDTAYLSIRAPTELPLTNESMDPAKRMFHWGDDLIFNAETAGFESDVGFETGLAMLVEVVEEVVVRKCGFERRDVFVWGYAQGGGLALRLADRIERMGMAGMAETDRSVGLGGIVSVGGPWYEPGGADEKYGRPVGAITDGTGSSTTESKVGTPAIVCRGDKASAVTDANAARLKDVFAHVEVVTWKDMTGDFMPRNHDQMVPVMKFFARRLRSRRGVPAGAVEVGREATVESG